MIRFDDARKLSVKIIALVMREQGVVELNNQELIYAICLALGFLTSETKEEVSK